MGVGAAKLAAIVGQDCTNRQSMLTIEGQDIIVQQQRAGFRLLAAMHQAEAVAAIGVHSGVQDHPCAVSQRADLTGIGAQEFTRAAAFHMALPKAGIVLLQHPDLLLVQLGLRLQMLAFQRIQPLGTRAQTVLVQNVLDGDRAQAHFRRFTASLRSLCSVIASLLATEIVSLHPVCKGGLVYIQLPYAAGSKRHCAPLRRIHLIASTKRRHAASLPT